MKYFLRDVPPLQQYRPSQPEMESHSTLKTLARLPGDAAETYGWSLAIVSMRYVGKQTYTHYRE